MRRIKSSRAGTESVAGFVARESVAGNRGARAVRSRRGAEMTSPAEALSGQKTRQRARPELPASASFVCSGTTFSTKTNK